MWVEVKRDPLNLMLRVDEIHYQVVAFWKQTELKTVGKELPGTEFVLIIAVEVDLVCELFELC